ncbi:HTTM domain-containing protein [Sandaracinus amylolyticus]|uniref:HTTM domain-containing protein n=1 Tax=Sandaracinus amylolyticus TaxID=927083 RepID=UPI00069D1EAB|nr:HTTM domain-containing protein [Sandaracinus amylolyticus]
MRSVLSSLWARAHQPTDAAALAVFRIVFGVLAVVIPTRFVAEGWVERFYARPTFHFTYWGFEWVRPLPAPWIHAVFVAMAICGALIALGLFYRVAIVLFFLLFTYVELIDVTTYLNHYYLVSVLALVMSVLPLHRAWSLDAKLRPHLRAATLPRWMTWLVRFQVGVVYVFAALAKLTSDWLLHAQPLQIWLGARMSTPVIGAYFDRIEVAYAMSWAGFLYDLTIPIWLSWRRTRPFAYAALLVFHVATGSLFQIGMFPWIMSVTALVFFDPSWPRAVLRVLGRKSDAPSIASTVPRFAGSRAVATVALGAWCAFHVLMPLRAYAYGGNVLWHEQGMRWSWRVLCREKNGSVTYRVRTRGRRFEREVAPRDYLTRDQEVEFSAQPDMILQLAHHIAREHRARGEMDVEVRVDAWVSLNGRRMARMIDPDVDLARVEDSLLPADWILPEPSGPPLDVATSALARIGER